MAENNGPVTRSRAKREKDRSTASQDNLDEEEASPSTQSPVEKLKAPLAHPEETDDTAVDQDPTQLTENACGGHEDPEVECSICLQKCVHPVQLPCSHVFCYLCVKGVANRSKRCALCRSEIPSNFVNKPKLLNKEDLLNTSSFDDGYQWFYSGNNGGWWRYEERTSEDLEDKYKQGVKKFDILIAGYMYVIDMEQMFQYRSTDPSRRRKIKRDQITKVDTKGIAGLSIKADDDSTERESGDGDNENTTPGSSATQTPSAPPILPSAPPLSGPLISSTPLDTHNNNRSLLLRSAFLQISSPMTDTHNISSTVSRSPPVTENNNDSLTSRMRDMSLGDDNPPYLIPRRRIGSSDSEMRRRRRRERESFTSLTRINTDSSESE